MCKVILKIDENVIEEKNFTNRVKAQAYVDVLISRSSFSWNYDNKNKWTFENKSIEIKEV